MLMHATVHLGCIDLFCGKVLKSKKGTSFSKIAQNLAEFA
jgi:hypothetical protein